MVNNASNVNEPNVELLLVAEMYEQIDEGDGAVSAGCAVPIRILGCIEPYRPFQLTIAQTTG